MGDYINLRMSYEKKPDIHFLYAYEQKANLPLADCRPALYLSAGEKIKYSHLKPFVVIHLQTSSAKNFRQVYGIQWQEIINYLAVKNYKIILIGEIETHYDNATYLATDLREMIALINSAALFIGIDSGPSHIADALQVPAIIFFGAVNPWLRHFKELFKGIIMQQYCEYAGCYHTVKNDMAGPVCKLVGDEGIPKCSVHTNLQLIENIEKLLSPL